MLKLGARVAVLGRGWGRGWGRRDGGQIKMAHALCVGDGGMAGCKQRGVVNINASTECKAATSRS